MNCFRSIPTAYKPAVRDTFILQDENDVNGHLYVIITKPFFCEEKDCDAVVVVNFSALDENWRKCVVQKGEHCFINKPSCIKFEYYRIYCVEKIKENVKSSKVLLKPIISHDLLKKIYDGVDATKQLPEEVRQLIKANI